MVDNDYLKMFITYFDLKKMSIELFNIYEEHKMEIYMTFFQESLYWDCTCAILYFVNKYLFTSIFKFDNKVPGLDMKCDKREELFCMFKTN